jgi:hypothetical protein
MQPRFQAGSTSKKLPGSFKTVYILRALMACCGLEVRDRAMGRLAFGPGHAVGAVAFIQVA